MTFSQWRALPEDKRPRYEDIQPEGESRFDRLNNSQRQRRKSQTAKKSRQRTYKERFANRRGPTGRDRQVRD